MHLVLSDIEVRIGVRLKSSCMYLVLMSTNVFDNHFSDSQKHFVNIISTALVNNLKVKMMVPLFP